MKFVLACLLIFGFLLAGIAAAGTAWAIPVALFAVAVGLAAVMESLA